MIKVFGLLLLLILLSFRTFAQTQDADVSHFLEGQDEGFFAPEQLPKNLQSSVNKLKILVFAIQKETTLTASEYQQYQRKELNNKQYVNAFMEHDPKTGRVLHPGRWARQRTAFDIQCQAKGDGYSCLWNDVVEYCAGFATEQGHSLWTAHHCLQKWQPSSEGQRVLYVYDVGVQLLQGPRSLSELGVDPATTPYQWSLDKVSTDSFQFHFATALPDYFELGRAPSANQLTFTLGFPSPTGKEAQASAPVGSDLQFRPRRGDLNSTGTDVMFARGSFVDSSFGQRLLSQGEDNLLPLLPQFPRLFFSTADAVAGFSGGPVINEAGQVIGLYSSGSSQSYRNGVVRSVTIAVRPESWK